HGSLLSPHRSAVGRARARRAPTRPSAEVPRCRPRRWRPAAVSRITRAVRRRAALLGTALAILCGCGPERAASPTRPAPELRWYRDLAIPDGGGDQPAMLADPGGGVW